MLAMAWNAKTAPGEFARVRLREAQVRLSEMLSRPAAVAAARAPAATIASLLDECSKGGEAEDFHGRFLLDQDPRSMSIRKSRRVIIVQHPLSRRSARLRHALPAPAYGPADSRAGRAAGKSPSYGIGTSKRACFAPFTPSSTWHAAGPAIIAFPAPGNGRESGPPPA